MLQEEDLREDFDALELELEQFEQEEREFADYCAEISGLQEIWFGLYNGKIERPSHILCRGGINLSLKRVFI